MYKNEQENSKHTLKYNVQNSKNMLQIYHLQYACINVTISSTANLFREVSLKSQNNS